MSRLKLFLVLALLNLLLQCILLPTHYNLPVYAFADAGSSLMASRLLHTGSVPYVDFNYYYGGVVLGLNEVWYALVGCTPLANHVLNLLCQTGLAWSLASLATVMGWNQQRASLEFLLISSPLLFCFFWYTTCHTLETALLILALARLQQRCLAVALLFATLALLVKPALAWFVGLLIVVQLCREPGSWRQRLDHGVRVILPSLALVLIYGVVMEMCWGMQALLHSLFPLAARVAYHEMGFGLLQTGRAFWLPLEGKEVDLVRHYLFTPAGLWILATLWLTWSLIRTGWRRWHRHTLSPPELLAAWCGGLHLIFLLLMFGSEASWTYDAWLLVLGMVVLLSRSDERGRLANDVVVVGGRGSCHTADHTTTFGQARFVPRLVLLLVGCSLVTTAASIRQDWSQFNSTPERHRLFMPRELNAELEYVETIARDRQVLMLHRQGAPQLVIHQVRDLPTWMLMRDSMTSAEHSALQQRLSEAEMIVVAQLHYIQQMPGWPMIAEGMKAFRLERQTRWVQYWRRVPPK